MARDDGRAPRGQRAPGAKPVQRGPHGMMVGALGLVGVVAAMMVEGFVDGAVFLAFVQEGLGPQLRPRQAVVLDNLKAHKVAGVREAIEAVGAQLIYLPPTRWTAPPSRHAGPISRRSCERRRHGPWSASGRPSRRLLRRSPARMLRAG